MKVETHNHPTAISPFPGAATGSGGEIRDEGATGRGAKPKAGLCGFSVSNLRIPGFEQPWETDHGKPARIASALDIMLEGTARRGCVQQRIRAAEPVRLFPHFRGTGALYRRARTARLPQADHDRRRLRQHPRESHSQARHSARRADRRAGRSGDADRAGRRRGVVGVQRRERRGPGLRVRAARQPGNAAPLPGGHRPLLGDGRRQSDPVHSRRRRRRPVQRAARAGATTAAAAGASNCAPCPTTNRACRRCRSGATKRRSATCWRSIPTGSRNSRRCASASAVPYRRGRRSHRRTGAGAGRRLFRQHAGRHAAAVLLGKPPKMLRDVHAPHLHQTRARTSTINLRAAVYRVLRLPAVASKTFSITIGDRRSAAR